MNQSYFLFISSQIRENKDSIFLTLKWYNDVIAFILDYISGSIKNSEVSGFYRYNIGFKNLLRSIEYGRKASTFGYRYLAQGFLERKYQHDFIRYEWLRKEYRNQTFQFLPEVSVQYTNITRGLYYGTAQQLITYKKQYQRQGLSNASINHVFLMKRSFHTAILIFQTEVGKFPPKLLQLIISPKVLSTRCW